MSGRFFAANCMGSMVICDTQTDTSRFPDIGELPRIYTLDEAQQIADWLNNRDEGYPVRWSTKDSNQANAEGWDIFFADGRGVYEIERNDINDPPYEDAPHWECDEDAIEHVQGLAETGSPTHLRAIAIHNSGECEGVES